MTAIRDEKIIILVIEKSMLIVWEVHVAGGHWDGAFRQIRSGSLGTIGRVGTEMDTSVVISHVLFNKAPAPPKPPRSSHPAERTHISIACVCVCNFQFSPQPKIATKTFSVTVCIYRPCFSTLMKF